MRQRRRNRRHHSLKPRNFLPPTLLTTSRVGQTPVLPLDCLGRDLSPMSSLLLFSMCSGQFTVQKFVRYGCRWLAFDAGITQTTFRTFSSSVLDNENGH